MNCVAWSIEIFMSNFSPALLGGGGCDTDEDVEDKHGGKDDTTTAKHHEKDPSGRPSVGLSMTGACLLNTSKT